MPDTPRRHALAETASTYGAARPGGYTKLSISLPTELVAQVQAAATETGTGVSGVIAAAIRHSLATSDQARLDRALEFDAEANEAWANDALAMTARAWADLEW